MPGDHAGKPFSAYLRAELLHSGGDREWRSDDVQTTPDADNRVDVSWQTQFEWEYEVEEMTFVRYVSTSFVHDLLTESGPDCKD